MELYINQTACRITAIIFAYANVDIHSHSCVCTYINCSFRDTRIDINDWCCYNCSISINIGSHVSAVYTDAP